MSSIERPHDPDPLSPETPRFRETAASPPASALDPRIGQRIGKYQLTRLLGAGGMGIVYAATDTVLDRAVAVKILSKELSADPEAVRRFRREARSASCLNHPNVVTVYEADQHAGAWFLVMELVLGGSAHELLRMCGALPWQEATRLIADACMGLVAAHSEGLIHRDIKPANLLRTSTGVGKLADFGLAKIFGRPVSSLTEAGHLAGTPDYMSPEQCKAQHLDERSDLYSLGATYYALLTGQPPYPGETPIQVMFAHCSGPVPNPRAVNSSIPPNCAAVVRRAMAKNRDQRFASAIEMHNALEALLGPEEAGNTRPAVELAPIPKRHSRLPRWSPLAVGVLFLALLVGGLAFLANRRPGLPVRQAAPSPPLTLKPSKVLLVLKGGVRQVRFSPDGKFLAAACSDHKARVWSGSGEKERILSGHTNKVLSVAFAPDGRTLFTSSDDKTIRAWDLASGTCLKTVQVSSVVYGLSFSVDGRLMAGACGYKGFTVWDYRAASDLSNPRPYVDSDGLLLTAAFASNGRTLLATAGKQVRILSVGTFAEEARLDEKEEVWAGDFSPDGQSIVFISNGGAVKRWEPGASRVPTQLLSTSPPLKCLAFSIDGGTLALGGEWGGRIRLLHLPTGKTTRVAVGQPGAIRSLAFAPNGQILVSATENHPNQDAMVQLWDVIPGE